MTKSRNTKKALFASLLSMLLCISMLMGSTFAWFTDSVTSGNNRIVAGNLDVELYHGEVTDDNKVTGETVLFAKDINNNPALWEPGVIVYENFTVKNVGTLALKYKLALKELVKNFVIEPDAATGEPTKTDRSLTDVIKVAVTTEEITNRNSAVEGKTFTSLEAFEAPTGALEPDESASFNVVLYWEPNAENDGLYNLKNGRTASEITDVVGSTEALMIEFGVDLLASQYAYESDSFDDQYDKDATDENGKYIVISTEKAELEASATTNNEQLTFTFPHDAPLPEGDTVVTFDEGAFPNSAFDSDADKHSVEVMVKTEYQEVTDPAAGDGTIPVAIIDLSLVIDGNEVHGFTSGKKVTITTKIKTGLTNVSVRFNGEGEQPEDVKYNSVTGELSFTTTHFGQFEVRYKLPTSTTLMDGKTLFKNSTGVFNGLLDYDEENMNSKLTLPLPANYSVKKVVFCDHEDLASKYKVTASWNSGTLISADGDEARVFVTSKKDAMYICVKSSTDIIYLNKDCTGMFSNLGGMTEIDFGEKVSFEKVENLYNFFNRCESLTKVTFGSKVDVSNVTDFGCMFSECVSLTELDLSAWNTPDTATIKKMFALCRTLSTVHIGEGWKLSKNASDFGNGFSGSFQTK